MTPLLDSKAVCGLLRVSPATLSRLVRANKIPYVLLGTGKTKLNVRFREEEIEAWIVRRSRGPGGMMRASSAPQPTPTLNGNTVTTHGREDPRSLTHEKRPTV